VECLQQQGMQAISSCNIFLFGDLKSDMLNKFITAQVTKLCDLGAEDTVCSVGWAQRGTHLAVGTNQGKVQVRSCSHLK
jgi:cell division cycle 20-like protein 1 (cofactor of APC complex)